MYSLPYILFTLYLCVLMFVEFYCIKTNKGIVLTRQIAIISFVLFFGLRYFVGYDIGMYYWNFTNLPTIFDITPSILKNKFEIGWVLYTILCKTIFVNFEIFVFINVLIDGIILNEVIKRYSKYYVLGLIIFIGYYGFIYEVEQLRNAKAVLIFLYSLRYAERREPWKYMLLNVIGMSFHTSAIVYLLVYPFLNKESEQKHRIIILAVCLVIFLFRIPIITATYDFFINISLGHIKERLITYKYAQLQQGLPLKLSISSLSTIFSYLLLTLVGYNRLTEENKTNNLFINLFILYAVCHLCFYEIGVLSTRVSALFIFAYVVLYPNLIASLETKTNKLLLVGLITLCSIGRLHIQTSQSQLYKYETIFNHSPLNQKLKEIGKETQKQRKGNIERNKDLKD